MDLRQLRYFVQVAEQQSFSRAASQLNVAQSALSRHMQILELDLGVKLLERHGRGAKPTVAGKVLLRKAGRLLRSMDELRQEVRSIGGGPAGHVSIAVPPSVSQIFAAPFIRTCAASLPHVTLNLSEGWSGDILDWLLTGHCDLGVIYSSQVDERVQFKPAFAEDLELVTAANSEIAGSRGFSLREVAALPLIVPPRPHGLRIVIESAFAESDLTPNFAFESQVWCVFKETVLSGKAHAIMAASEIAADIRRGRMVSVPIVNPSVNRTLGLAMTRQREHSHAVRAVFDIISRIPRPVFTGEQSVV